MSQPPLSKMLEYLNEAKDLHCAERGHSLRSNIGTLARAVSTASSGDLNLVGAASAMQQLWIAAER